jgi:hypothetical protein
MAGAWLTAFACAVTTRESFERMVSPAIADLQHETVGRRTGSWQAYAAVWMTLARAVAQDFSDDSITAFDRQTVRRMLNVTTWTFLLLVVVPRVWALAEIGLERRAELMFSISSLPSAVVSVLPVLMLPLATVVAGRRHSRAILLVAGGTALLALGLQAFVVPAVQRVWSAPAIRAVLGIESNGIRGELAVRETVEEYVSSRFTGQPFGPVFLDEPYPERRHVDRVHSAAAIASALAFALCGSALRMRRDWAIVAVTVPVYLLWVWLSTFALVWMSGLGFDPTFRGLLPTVMVFVIGTTAMTLRFVLDRRRLAWGMRSG